MITTPDELTGATTKVPPVTRASTAPVPIKTVRRRSWVMTVPFRSSS